MAEPTRPRGRPDTTGGSGAEHPTPVADDAVPAPPVAVWRGGAGKTTGFAAEPRALRRFVAALWVALLLHLPLLPNNIAGWLRFLLEPRDQEIEEVDGEAIIPIDFDFGPDGPAPAANAEAPPPAPLGEDAIPVFDAGPPPRKRAPVADAGADADAGGPADAGGGAAGAGGGGAGDDGGAPAALPPDGGAQGTPGGADAGLVVQHTPDAGPEDAGADAAPAEPDAGPAIKDPLAVAAAQAKLFKHPNVQIWVASDRIRKHELGGHFGRLLTRIPEWKGFFAGTAVDPIRDLDQLLIAGPQLRDSRKIVAMMYYNVPERKIRGAIDHLIAGSTPKGEWLKDTPVEAARATADRGERIFALVGAKRLLVVLPPEAKDQLAGLKDAKPLGKPGVGILASTITPANALRELPLRLPSTLTWVGISVTPTADGGADLLIEAVDKTPELAAEHAADITQQIETVRKVEVLGASFEAFQRVEFVATGKRMRASTHVKVTQLRFLMLKIEEQLDERERKRQERERARDAAAAPSGDGGASEH